MSLFSLRLIFLTERFQMEEAKKVTSFKKLGD